VELLRTHPRRDRRWFKQATCGDCDTAQPSVFKVEARAKWGAWDKMRGENGEECRSKYLSKLEEAVPGWLAWGGLAAHKQALKSQRSARATPSHAQPSTPSLMLLQGGDEVEPRPGSSARPSAPAA